MNNEEILSIQIKNPNKPDKKPVQIGIFPASIFVKEDLVKIVANAIGVQIQDINVLSSAMEQNLRDEFQKLVNESYITGVTFTNTPDGKRCAQFTLVEK